jgi:hypothetical protein
MVVVVVGRAQGQRGWQPERAGGGTGSAGLAA